jgi:rhamnosyltransferase
MISNKLKLFSVVVAYNPEYNKLLALCQVLSSSDITTVLIDNSDINKIEFTEISKLSKIHIINLFDNFGIAKAQNIGINYALTQNADAIIFFDQDSQIDSSFLSNLIAPLSNDNISICAPLFIDFDSEIQLPVISINKFGLISYSNNFQKELDNKIVISSGLIVKSEIFNLVGLMNEEYFIDYVDTDFCFRCFARNIKINVVPNAVMKHPVGDKMVKILGFYFFIHNPQRVYYQIRNCFLFSSKNYVPLLFRLREIISLAFHQFFLMCFYYKNRLYYLKAFYYGFLHGLIGKSGKSELDLNFKS